MAYFNAVSDKLRTAPVAFASTGSMVQVAAFKHDDTVTTASTTEFNTHFFFAAVAKGDIVHTYMQGGSLQATATSTLKFDPSGGAEVTIATVLGTASTAQKGYVAPYWTAPSDGVLFVEISRYQKREEDDNGIWGTALISRPALPLPSED